jgi:acyl dehydratase
MEVVKTEVTIVGEQLPALTKPPITRATLAYFCGASNDHNPIHVDLDFARAAGRDDVFAHGMLSMAYVGQMLTNWIPQSRLRSFEVKFGAIVHLGDQITCRGVVVEEYQREGEQRLRIKLSAVDQRGEVKLTGEAAIALENTDR